MTEPTLLRQIVEANKSFLAGTARYLDPAGEPFVVVACIDPRLTGFLEPALGLPRHRAVVIRTAGNQLSERTRDELRSLAAAVYIKKAGEVLVVGHTDCSMAAFSASEVADAFRKAGIPRSAFGDDDLRTWFGAFASIRNNVISSVEFLRKSGLLPRSTKIHGLILETNLGSIEVVLDGDLAARGAAPPPLESESAKAPPPPIEKDKKEGLAESRPDRTPQAAAPASAAQKSKKGPVVVGQPAAAARGDQAGTSPDSLFAAALVLRNFIHQQRHDQKLQKAIAGLKTTWQQEKSPSRIFAELGNITRAYESDYPNLRGALLYLENAVKSGSADKIGIAEIMKRLLD
jgi:carbonic anhydrase